jgi:hypothetical protein
MISSSTTWMRSSDVPLDIPAPQYSTCASYNEVGIINALNSPEYTLLPGNWAEDHSGRRMEGDKGESSVKFTR